MAAALPSPWVTCKYPDTVEASHGLPDLDQSALDRSGNLGREHCCSLFHDIASVVFSSASSHAPLYVSAALGGLNSCTDWTRPGTAPKCFPIVTEQPGLDYRLPQRPSPSDIRLREMVEKARPVRRSQWPPGCGYTQDISDKARSRWDPIGPS